MKRFRVFLVVAVSCLWGCATTKPIETTKIDYMPQSVPEEGGISFTKITQDANAVFVSNIERTERGLGYSPRQIFSLTKEKIVFRGYKNQKTNVFIRSLQGGGRSLQQRTFSELVADPSISPDGKNIVFADNRGGNWNIYMIATESGFATRQITNSNASEHSPIFSPDNSKILFVQGYSDGSRSWEYLWTYDLTNDALTQYVEGYAPSFTPDGKKVVATRGNRETGYPEIWLIDFEKGQEFLILSAQDRGFLKASVSPDGKKLAVVSASFGKNLPRNFDIFFVNIDGTGLTQITYHPGHDLCPRWSPDGRSLYFVSQRGTAEGNYNIWRMNLKNH